MTHYALIQAIERYEAAISALETAGDRVAAEDILDVLAARDQIREELNQHPHLTLKQRIRHLKILVTGGKSAYVSRRRLLRQIDRLDTRLGQQTDVINRAVKLADWDGLLHPPERDWLRLLDPPKPIPLRDRFDWLWQGLSIAFLTVSLSLLTDIAMRLLEGGPDAIGAFAVIVPSVLGLLTGGGAVTKTGKQAIEHILGSLQIAKHWWDELNCLISLLLLISLLIFWLSLPIVSQLYEAQADSESQQGNLANAETLYNRALKLSPEHLDLHYKLGRLYEDLREDDLAMSQYQIAVKGGQQGNSYKAHDRLARLYILKGDTASYSKAISLLNEGLVLANQHSDVNVQYAIDTDIGWARLKQERYLESIDSLQKAIRLFDDRAPAHCLRAQALEGLNNRTAALGAWEQCLRYANQKDPDEDIWIGLASKRLQVEPTQPAPKQSAPNSIAQ